ncbi:MAG: NAD+ synthase [Alphaproteobacteria bacterium]|nr:NAD+ synthase [Alphaproteobacteria bacterium]
MPKGLIIAMAQTNPHVGHLAHNLAMIDQRYHAAVQQKADLVVFSELVVCGYPPDDLVLNPAFVAACRQGVHQLAAITRGQQTGMIVGAPWVDHDRLYNAALLLADGEVQSCYFKHELPNYGVFDEKRLFSSAPLAEPMMFRGHRLGLMICEDMWYPAVGDHLTQQGAELLICINGSPFEQDKLTERLDMAKAQTMSNDLALIYVNQVGGQDELVFDGRSFVMTKMGVQQVTLAPWAEDLAITHWRREQGSKNAVNTHGKLVCSDPPRLADAPETLADFYQALVLGLRDYAHKNGFDTGVLIGLSGGIDSALTAAIAVDALGRQAVHGVFMPSPYTAQQSYDDVADLVKTLSIPLDTISISPAIRTFANMLDGIFSRDGDDLPGKGDVTEENIQSRVRGMILMAMSNKYGRLVLSTGNKSEMSVGYATLYGDMCGGYALLKDLYKTTVYELARWRNSHYLRNFQGPAGVVISDSILQRPPTAELRPNQTDQDKLPPYDQLDAILQGLIEQSASVDELVAGSGLHMPQPRPLVQKVRRWLDLAEYKRRQAPPGVKLTSKAFGRDRRYPITNGWEG